MFELVLTESAISEVRDLSKTDQNLILDTVEQQ
jgi:mRNA-degrading endonuclease RelE of RelBE toxin-antitoxin system